MGFRDEKVVRGRSFACRFMVSNQGGNLHNEICAAWVDEFTVLPPRTTRPDLLNPITLHTAVKTLKPRGLYGGGRPPVSHPNVGYTPNVSGLTPEPIQFATNPIMPIPASHTPKPPNP